MKAIYPITITSKVSECQAFYQEVFGFSTVFEADWYVQLLHKKSGVELAFMKPNADNQPQRIHGEYSGNGVIYSFEVENAAVEYERIQKQSSNIFYPLATEEWGQTHFMLTDPAGVVVDVVQQAKG